jgi:chemosensory pili system protein ChpA (sensor histidine kinase/response regulator)
MNARLHPHNANGLAWVSAELTQSLARVRALIEQYAESGEDALQLQKAFVELHQVRGTATMIQCFGVAVAAEEMKQTLQELMHNRIGEPEPAYSALLGATIQLGDYIEALATGVEDCVLVLQPVLNELRLSRAKPVLTEADLFVSQMRALGMHLPVPEDPQRSSAVAQAEAKKLMAPYQSALLHFVRNDAEATTGLARMAKIAEQIAATVQSEALYQLWRSVAAVVEALLGHALEDSIDVKRLFGAAGQQLKTLGDEGEEAAQLNLGDLALNFLFFVGRSRGQGERVQALRKACHLQTYLPPAAQIEELRRRIHGPNAQLLGQVSEEIRQDFAQIKDVIDLAVRGGGKGDFTETRERLQRVANTLTMLGLPVFARVVANQSQLLEKAGQGSDPKLWMDVATSILRIEHSLEDALFRHMRLNRLDRADGDEIAEETPHTQDLREGKQALLRESLIDLAKLKSNVDTFIREGAAGTIAEAARMLGEVGSGFRILDSERAAQLAQQLERYVRSPAFQDLRGSRSRAERFADAIAAVEYYVEAVRDRLPESERLLDDLAGFVEQLEFSEEPVPAAMALQAAAPPDSAAAPPADAVDPEIRDIFLEEVEEVRQTLLGMVPRWARDTQDRDALTTIRRAFHTLKGSGRMAGAQQIGEFGWAVENLLNRCLDGSRTLGPPVVETVQRALELLPALIAAFRDGTPEPEVLPGLIEQAKALAEGRETVEPEADMLGIFREDAREKLATVSTWIEETGGGAPDAEVIRAFHTLRGSAHVVGAQAIADIAAAVEAWLDAIRSAKLGLEDEAVQLLGEITATLKVWVEEAGTVKAAEQRAAPWVERIQALQAEVPEQAVQEASDRQLAEIFAGEAFDLVGRLEAAAQGWARAPEQRQSLQEMRDIAHTLMGAALMSEAPAIAASARALHQQLGPILAADSLPAVQLSAALVALMEGFYQQIDAYREGTADADAGELVRRIQALGREDAAAAAAPPPAPAPAPAPQVVPAAPVPKSAPVPAPAAAPVEADAELLEIFLGEAQELMEQLDGAAAGWERNPYAREFAADLKRTLHTLKGSARMAGLVGIGEVAHRLETLIEQHSAQQPERAFFNRLRNVCDGLHQALDQVQRGQTPATELLLAELEGSATPAPDPAPAPVVDEPPAAPPATDREEQADDDADPELAAIFEAEAAEILEGLEQSLQVWQADPAQTAPLRDIQRALHTLKGGARMAGMMEMGNVAHEMEERVNALEGAGAPDSAAFAGLQTELERLQALHDGTRVPVTAPALTPAVDTPRQLLASGWDPLLFWKPEEDSAALSALRRETARVPVETLDSMLNEAGEISIYRSRLEEQNAGLKTQLAEMEQAIQRLRDQLRQMDAETDAQIAARGRVQAGEQHDRYASDFDPLEMDRYTRMQELSRALNESVGDLSALHGTMDGLVSAGETLLLQQGRINTEVQQGLMGTLMVPFSRQVARLQRVVRQTAQENGKLAEAVFNGVEAELDRNVLERMTAPLEHLLRNAVVHGLETPEERRAAGKPETGTVRVTLKREGAQLALELADDGRGLNFDAIRQTAIKRGLMPPDADIADEDVAQFIFEPGFSTARKLTQDAGRGIGMDVVASEVKQLGGTLEIGSETGKGARFVVRLPLTLAISQALLVRVGPELYAIPLSSIEGIARIPRDQLTAFYREDGPLYSYGGGNYRVRYLGDFIGVQAESDPADSRTVSAILVRLGEGLGAQERRVAVVVDALLGNREVVSKAAGSLISSISGISSATILADGQVVLILDVPALAQDRTRRALISAAAVRGEVVGADERELILVVDDSITIRRVTERLLTKNGYRVATAKDGLDAMAQLQTLHPAAVLLDIEMPRADGFEVAMFMRNNERVSHTPIIMITSRSGDKHRTRALELGVNRYMIKPYQEEQLMSELRSALRERARH